MRKSLLISALILALMALPAFASEEPAPQAETLYKIDIADAPYIGPIDAPVTIIEFIDYQ